MPTSLWEVRGRTREIKPNCSPAQADGFINRRIRNALDSRTWSDTVKIGMIIIPNGVNDGTVNLTPGMTTVVGNGTSWPINDAVNGSLSVAISQAPGFADITPSPGVIGSIQVGSLLLIDAGSSAQEVIAVRSIGPTMFSAYCQFNHNSGATLVASSYAGRQFATDAYVYTIQAVLASNQLLIDFPYGGQPQNGVSYMIRKQYVSPSPTAKYLKDQAWDAIAGCIVGTSRDFAWLNLVDPQRQSTGNPQELCRMPANPAGIMQWEMWPFQTTQYALACIYEDGWPTLRYDTDLLPPFINPEVIIAGACADALRTKVIPREGKTDPYYDPDASRFWDGEYLRLLEQATQSDQGRRLTQLTNYREMLESYSFNWLRSHAVSASGVGWGY